MRVVRQWEAQSSDHDSTNTASSQKVAEGIPPTGFRPDCELLQVYPNLCTMHKMIFKFRVIQCLGVTKKVTLMQRVLQFSA